MKKSAPENKKAKKHESPLAELLKAEGREWTGEISRQALRDIAKGISGEMKEYGKSQGRKKNDLR